jgi:uncharacterized membrane protein YphA (DoxX/SURF4 family)
MSFALLFDPLPVWIARACIATLFVHAALAKWADLPLTEQHLAAYGVPHRLLSAAVRALPALELLAGALLLTPWREAGAALAALLLAVYGTAMAWHRLHGRALDCGCGGEPLAVSWALVARNAVLAAVAALAAAPAGVRTMTLADFGVVAAAVLLATLLYAALHQLLRHRANPSLRRT